LYPLALIGFNESTNVFVNYGRLWFAQDHSFNSSSPTTLSVCSFPAAGFFLTVSYNNTCWDPHYGARYYELNPLDLPATFRWALDIKIPFVAPVPGEAVTRNSWRISQPNAGAIGPNPPTIGSVKFNKTDPCFVSTVGVVGKVGMRSPCTGTDSASGFQVTCESWWGDCGSPYLSSRGIVGTHVAMNTSSYNLGHSYVASKLSPHSPAFVPRTPAPATHVVAKLGEPASVSGVKFVAPARRRTRNRRKAVQRAFVDIYNESSYYQQHRGIPDSYRPFCQSYRPADVLGRPLPLPRKAKSKPASRESYDAREAALTNISAPGSDYLGPNGQPAGGFVSRYTQMVTNPWSGSMVRLPDVNITPTALAKFFANRTFTVPAVDSASAIVFGCNSRLGLYGDAPRDVTNFDPATGLPVYDYAPGTIMAPQVINSTQTTIVPVLAGPPGPWSDDYGDEQSATTLWTAAYRTLAMAIRVRVVGLPAGVFMAPGKIYFAQIRYDATDFPVKEQDFVVLERLGRATHVSLDAVRESGSKTFFAVPDSADKFNMTSEFFIAPGFSTLGGNTPTGQAVRRFPSIASLGPLGFGINRAFVPYDSVTDRGLDSTATHLDACTADQTMVLVCGVFGSSTAAETGPTLEVDYAHIVEYIPSSNAPPGLETVVQLPSSTVLDSVFSACAVATELRPVLLQAPGDLTITSPAPTATNASVERARNVQRRMSALSERFRGAALPHSRREGWFDWLGAVDLKWGDWSISNKKADPPSKRK